MSDFRARSNAELLDAAFEIYRRYFPAFFAISVVWALPSIVSVYFQQAVVASSAGVAKDPFAALTPAQTVMLTSLFVRVLITPFAEGAMTALASDAYLGAPTDLAAATRAALAHPWRLSIAWWTRAIFEFLGAMVFLVPGLVIFKRYFAIEPTVILEHRGVSDSIKRSRILADGSGVRIFVLIGGVWLFTVVVSIMLGGFITAVSQSAITGMLGVIVLAALYPFSIIITTLLYYDIRIRKEGYDIELLAAGLDTSPHPQPLPAS
ncbi:MAG TPA: hypothetical protein VGT98_01345 [Candidatus Elarobacter sp.]|nr:hypothetical protein [Candidatus Elarobacter sp.]